MSWSPTGLLGEVARTILARPLQYLVVTLVIAGVGLAAGGLDMIAWRDAAALRTVQESAGSLVIRATARDGSSTIDAAACLALDRSSGVAAAGGIGASRLVHAATSPGLGFRVLPAAGNITQALTGASAAPSGPGLIVADAVAEQVGLRAGSLTSIDGTVTPVVAVAPLGQRDQELGRIALTLTTSPRTLTACYVAFTDEHALRTLSNLLPATFAATGDNLTLTRMFATGDGIPDPSTLWDTRPARYLYLAAGTLAVLILTITVRAQRHEYAIYLITGTTRAGVAGHVLVAGHAIVLTALAITIAWLTLLGHLGHVPAHGIQLGIAAAVRTTITATALLPLTLAWLAHANIHRLLRETAA
ncbi:hypothetical protein [Xylanimonas sp. McL0601]|uniref:hypothetical protein n=1 Tax=Xylanimonas sp. McL0601 TaxID=3414739 RepID=UPI003CEAF6DD